MKKEVCILFLFFLITVSGFAQLKSFTFEQVDSLQHIQNRKIVVFIYIDWCKYCHAMKNITFKKASVIEMLNENFYFIALNAEEKRKITFNNQEYFYKSNGNSNGIHDLAFLLANHNNQTIYPTLCVLNAKNEIVFQQSNFLTSNDLQVVLEELKKY